MKKINKNAFIVVLALVSYASFATAKAVSFDTPGDNPEKISTVVDNMKADADRGFGGDHGPGGHGPSGPGDHGGYGPGGHGDHGGYGPDNHGGPDGHHPYPPQPYPPQPYPPQPYQPYPPQPYPPQPVGLCHGTFNGSLSNGVRISLVLNPAGWNNVGASVDTHGGGVFYGQGTCDERNGQFMLDIQWSNGPARFSGTIYQNGYNVIAQGGINSGLTFSLIRR